MGWRAGLVVLALLVGVAGFLVPFYALYADRALLPIVFTFASLGLLMVLLGAFLVLRARALHRRARAADGPDDEEESRLLVRGSFGWVWVALGLALLGFQMALLFIAVFVPRGS